MATKKAAKKSSAKKRSTKKASTKKSSTKKASTKKAASKKSSAKKSTSRKTASKKSSRRKYSPSAGKDVEREMHAFKRGELKSGRGGKGGTVKSRKQAIAIGLSEARAKGKKVPKKKS